MRELTFDDLQRAVAMLVRVSAMVRDDGNTAVASHDHIAIITHFHQLKGVNALIKTSREALSEIEDSFSRQHIPEILREKSIKSINVEGIGNVVISHRYSCSIIPEDKTIGHQWLVENGHGGLITETVNSSTLASFAKNMLVDEGKELPPEIFKVGTQAFTSIRKS